MALIILLKQFCLDRVNVIILGQIFNKMQRQLLLFCKEPTTFFVQDLQDYPGVINAQLYHVI